jgi:hypothetical protein
LDGHGKAEAGFMLSEALARDGATERGVQDIWSRYLESNKPDDEVRSKHNLSNLMCMLQEKNGRKSSYHPRISRRLSPGLQPETRDAIFTEPFDSPDLAANPQPKIVNVRDAIRAEVLDLPDAREKRHRGNRSPASSGSRQQEPRFFWRQ